MTHFLLNDKEVRTAKPLGIPLVDVVREEYRLKGATVACREGDCGCCTLLVGELVEGKLCYHPIVSCISPLGAAQGKHIVTIEGIAMKDLHPIQRAFVEHSATQCGFCTPGFIVSLLGFLLSSNEKNEEEALASIDGNICRCTGYLSIRRAIRGFLDEYGHGSFSLGSLVERKLLPDYFLEIPQRLSSLLAREKQEEGEVIGGGTDLFVQRPDALRSSSLVFSKQGRPQIYVREGICEAAASMSVEDFLRAKPLEKALPRLKEYRRLFASTQVRSQGTIAGNIVNASPIGDLTCMLLALDATLTLQKKDETRQVKLSEFFQGYKKIDLDKEEGEVLAVVSFPLPSSSSRFHFEKGAKRTHLDIASVNTAAQFRVEKGRIQQAFLSAGGIAPTPQQLKNTMAFLEGKEVSPALFPLLLESVEKEVAPISDVRGSASYKRQLLKNLLLAHCIECFPELRGRGEA